MHACVLKCLVDELVKKMWKIKKDLAGIEFEN